MDLIRQEEERVLLLIRLLQEKQKLISQEEREMHVFFTKRLQFLWDEKERIELRCQFVQGVYETLRKAKQTLSTSTDEAQRILVSGTGLLGGGV